MNEVEKLLDSCHALMNYGVDRYKRPEKISIAEEKARQEEREAYLQSQVNALWRTVPKKAVEQEKQRRFPSEPQENILYLLRNTPLCWSLGNVKSCVLCVKSASIFIHKSRRKS